MVPLPKKFINKICKLEYVDMKELLSVKFLCGFKEKDPTTDQHPNMDRMFQLTSISVVHKVSMAYMIIKCQRFEGLGWFHYDRAYRRQVTFSGKVHSMKDLSVQLVHYHHTLFLLCQQPLNAQKHNWAYPFFQVYSQSRLTTSNKS